MQVVIMRGLPGSGKSTLAKRFGGHIVSADDYFMAGGQYQFDPTKLSEAHGQCLSRFVAFLLEPWDDEPIVVDNTNVSWVEVAPYHRLAEAYGYPVSIFNVAVDPGVAFARQTHGVPAAAFEAMVERFTNPGWNPFARSMRDITDFPELLGESHGE